MTTGNDDFDFLDRADRDKAVQKAREAALAPPKRRPRTTKQEKVRAHVLAAIKYECDELSVMAPDSGRNERLNVAAFNLGQLVGARVATRSEVEHALEIAARNCKMHLDKKDGGMQQVRKTIRSGLDSGEKKPRDMSDVGIVIEGEAAIPAKGKDGRPNAEVSPAAKAAPANSNGKASHVSRNGKAPEPEPDDELVIKMVPGSAIKTRVPSWVWEYDGKGRIQLGTLTMFAGKPAAGKSTAVRWFIAQITNGTLPGCWEGHPMKVAVVSAEEQLDAVVVPGLAAAGADLRNCIFPDFGDRQFVSTTFEKVLTEQLVDNEVRALFVDPIMATMGGKTDVYRNNEVREYLAPYVRIAEALNGIVIGVTHLKKGEVRDTLSGINGSGAFGEVPRAVFGFAPMEEGAHVVEQVKNSAGAVGLRLEYRLPIQYLTADDGQLIELPAFQIIGPTDISIADINPNSNETTDIAVAKQWLLEYLLTEQPARSSEIKRVAKTDGDIEPWTLKRAMKELKVRVSTRSMPGKPRITVWTLPDYAGPL